jgi:hypothetical protein
MKVPSEAKRGPSPAKKSMKLVTRLIWLLVFSRMITTPKKSSMAPQAR